MFYCACIDAPNYCIVLEYVCRGSLEKVLLDPINDISHERRLSILCDIARGVLYLHSQSPPIIHRDLKSDNILVSDYIFFLLLYNNYLFIFLCLHFFRLIKIGLLKFLIWV